MINPQYTEGSARMDFVSARKHPRKHLYDILLIMQLMSSVFINNSHIPSLYTCDSNDISPPLNWANEPEETKTYSLTCHDPDAPDGGWVHWVMWNIPSKINHLPEHIPTVKSFKNGSQQGTNDFKKIGYGGPCPPSGVHRYIFKLYALDIALNLPSTRTQKDLEAAMTDHILQEASLIGTYNREG